jgi:hypothetical protein
MTDDVVEIGICPLCNKPMKSLSYPEAVEFHGQTVHSKCAAEAAGDNPQRSNSYT